MKIWKIFIVLITVVSVGALVSLYVFGKGSSKDLVESKSNSSGVVAGVSTISNDDYLTNLAKSLNTQGVILYCSYQSSDCKDQQNQFKNAFQYVNYVECDASGPDANPDECLSQNVDTYPTWIYQGKQYEGEQSLANLAKIINYSN